MNFLKNIIEVSQVDVLSGYIDDDCTHFTTWYFNLPFNVALEMKNKYNIPKYREVTVCGKKEVLFLDCDTFQIEYTLSANADGSCGEFDGTDFRLASKYNGKEEVAIIYRYDILDDDMIIDVCEDEDYVELENGKYCLPQVEITGDDKNALLDDLHEIMVEILDGDSEKRKRLIQFCGD